MDIKQFSLLLLISAGIALVTYKETKNTTKMLKINLEK